MTKDLSLILSPVVNALAADGYAASVAESGGVVRFEITATTDVCEECLSPPKVIGSMIQHLLNANNIDAALELIYPVDPTHEKPI